jgi:flagellar biosynthesis/type III secretory pathway protein FliH
MDLRIEKIFSEEMFGDTSFQEKESTLNLFIGKPHKKDLKEVWDMGIKKGIEIGLRKASLEGQKIELNQNTLNEKHREFLKKFYELCAEYNTCIQYHPEAGMVVLAR